MDGLVDDADYERQKAQYKFDLTALVVPQADAVADLKLADDGSVPLLSGASWALRIRLCCPATSPRRQ